MRLNGVKTGDVVECDVKGWRFFARVEETLGMGGDLAGGRYQVSPISPRVTYRRVTSRQVVGLYRRSAGSR